MLKVIEYDGNLKEIAQKLNNLNQKTATGMEYNSVRAAAMYRKLKKIMK